ncbi:winged helix-turn-helix domain-containing protein [Streptomyces sp. NPDC006863]|uniref:helix-turn-helix domain-containing protein n=1 Tax=unclassified Streptomyces TaxID=2593676 RepID=UPI0033F4C885
MAARKTGDLGREPVYQELHRFAEPASHRPAPSGWWWTLARVAELVHRLFGSRYTPPGVPYLLHRLGWSPQVPAHRACAAGPASNSACRRTIWPSLS